MALLTINDQTYTLVSQGSGGPTRGVHKRMVFRVQTPGSGSPTYPSNGVPLDKGKMGCPTYVTSLKICGNNTVTTTSGAGQVPEFKWDGSATAPKIKAYGVDPTVGASPGVLIELPNATALAVAQDLYVEVEGY